MSPNDRVSDQAMRATRKLRHVDPRKRHGRLYLAICRFSASKVGGWLSVNVAWKVDPYLLKLTNGRLSTAWPVAADLLETLGARTGRPRRNATLYFHDGDRVTIIATFRGRPSNPAWYYNLLEHPHVVFGAQPFGPKSWRTHPSGSDFGSSPTASTPRTATSASRPGAGRVVPIIQLVPR